MAKALKSKTMHGVAWSAIERFSVQGVQFVIQILMARLLLPSDYGVIGVFLFFLHPFLRQLLIVDSTTH